MSDLVLPAFELDCRDWIVTNPTEVGMPEDVGGAPLLAVLSTMVVEDDVLEATGGLTVGFLDGSDDLVLRDVAPGSPAQEMLDPDLAPGTRRFVVPAPGHQLALLAEFMISADSSDELQGRVEALMTSFRWQLN